MPKILVIEDMPESAEMTAQILRRYGHQVWIAENGDAGIGLAAQHAPDLIICDYWLADQDARFPRPVAPNTSTEEYQGAGVLSKPPRCGRPNAR
jgi:DNA-binding NarL/FixJ family response regulator